MTKKELIEQAALLGLGVDKSMTKSQISDMIDYAVAGGALKNEVMDEPVEMDSREILGIKPLSIRQKKNMTHTQVRAYNRLHGYK